MLGPKTSKAREGFLPNKNTNEKQWCDVGHDNDNVIDDYIYIYKDDIQLDMIELAQTQKQVRQISTITPII